jgi:WD40 repeat protein
MLTPLPLTTPFKEGVAVGLGLGGTANSLLSTASVMAFGSVQVEAEKDASATPTNRSDFIQMTLFVNRELDQQVLLYFGTTFLVADVHTGSMLCSKSLAHSRKITTMLYNQSYDYHVSGSADGCIKVWSPSSYSSASSGSATTALETIACRHLFIGHASKVTGLLQHPTYRQFISSSEDGTLRVWSVDPFEFLYLLDTASAVFSLHAHSDPLLFLYHNTAGIQFVKINNLYDFCSLAGSQVSGMVIVR